MEVNPGYKRTEAGVIPEMWEVKRLRDVLKVRHGKSQHGITKQDGKYPILASGGEIGRTNAYIYDQPSVLIGRKGTIDSPQYVDSPFWTVDTLFFTEISSEANAKFVFYKFMMIRWRSYNEASGVPSLNSKTIENIEVTMPPLPEQRAIAEALSDVDGLLGGLDRLIAKKRDLKQAAMQQLLTGQARLPGFRGEWEVKRLGDVASVSKGNQLHSSESDEGGKFAHLNGGITPSSYTHKSNSDGNTIAISEGGNSCGFVQFMTEPYWCGGHCYSVIPNSVDNLFLYHALKGQQSGIMGLRVGSGLPNVQKTGLLDFKFELPATHPEQTAIAEVLTEMDAELAALEQRREKTCALKQAMMQELLTGRTRLI